MWFRLFLASMILFPSLSFAGPKEDCIKSGGKWVVNDAGDGFCFGYLQPMGFPFLLTNMPSIQQIRNDVSALRPLTQGGILRILKRYNVRGIVEVKVVSTPVGELAVLLDRPYEANEVIKGIVGGVDPIDTLDP